MLSAVESFGSAASAATHPYAHHHNPFAIAAAAAAAGSAAAVIPSQSHMSAQNSLEQYTLAHASRFSSSINNHHHNIHDGMFISPSTNVPLSLTSSSSVIGNSSRFKAAESATTMSDMISMTSAEFARPHPKQPRYSTTITNNNNNNLINTNNKNNNTINSNGIPVLLRNTKIGGNNNIISTNNNNHQLQSPTIRSKYSTEQTGPVNLVTNNNSNNNINNNNCLINNNNLSSSGSRSLCGSPTSHRESSLSVLVNGSLNSNNSQTNSSANETDMLTGIYSSKLPYTTTNTANNVNIAANYQYNYPNIYAGRSIYGHGTPALYSGHHTLNGRPQLHGCPSYLGPHHETQTTFTPYLPPSATYSPPLMPAHTQPNILRSTTQTVPLALSHSASNLTKSGHKNNQQFNEILDNNKNIGYKLSHHQQQAQPPSISNHNNSEYNNRIDEKELNQLNGTYLKVKMNTSPPEPESVSGFKVPSGKEGSLKHRILTRPLNSERRKSPITASILRSSTNSNALSNFTKGAYIELSNGVLRRVEDMRTEDFIQSAEKSQKHQLADSTVVKINTMPNSVIITFSYDKNRSKADVEVSLEHPFFVYGQGWASCNPDQSFQLFGLKCQRLQVGDVCISLMSRDTIPSTANTGPCSTNSFSNNSHSTPELLLLPQNLSRKSQSTSSTTIPTTATCTAVSSRLVGRGYSLQQQNFTNHAQQMYGGDFHSNNETTNPIQISRNSTKFSSLRNDKNSDPIMHTSIHHSIHRLTKPVMLCPSQYLSPAHISDIQMSPPPQSLSAPVSRPPSNQPFYLGIGDNTNNEANSIHSESEEQPVDATISRKRRWSAPDNIFDEDDDNNKIK